MAFFGDRMKSNLAGKVRTDKERNSALDYPLMAPKANGTAVQITEGILWIRMPMPMTLDHINLYLLEDDDGWFIIDTGLHTNKTKELWLVVAENHCQIKPIKGLICTHFHYDHSSLAQWLMDTFNIPLFMTYGEFYTLATHSRALDTLGHNDQRQFYQHAGVPLDTVEKIFEACRKDPYMAHSPNKFNRLRHDDVLTIGKRRWRIVIGEGHSPEHACLYCEEDKLLLAGDQLLPHISSNILVSEIEPMGQPLKNWLHSLKQMQSLDANTLVMPAHGPIFTQMHVRAQQLIDHHFDTLATLQDFARHHSQFNAYEAMQHLFNRKLSPIDTLMALGETLAHLNWLEANEDLQCQRQVNEGVDMYCSTQSLKLDRKKA